MNTMNARWNLRPATCDCHVHIYEDGYPLAPTPPQATDAPVKAYREVQQSLDWQRVCWYSQPGYGFDNRCLLDSLKQFGTNARGICIIAAIRPTPSCNTCTRPRARRAFR